MFFHFSVEEDNTFFSTCSAVLPKEIKKNAYCFFLLILFLNNNFIDEKLSSHRLKVKNNHRTRSVCKNMPTYNQGTFKRKIGAIIFSPVLAFSLVPCKFSKHIVYQFQKQRHKVTNTSKRTNQKRLNWQRIYLNRGPENPQAAK